MKRITIIDALRGFSLFGIILAHMMEQYYGGEPPKNVLPAGVSNFGMVGTLNVIVGFIVMFLVSGKFFAIFSLLFGLSFYIQMDRAHQKGINFKRRFLWRLTILLGIGYVHGLFYAGDILLIYALLGVLLVFFYSVKSKYIISTVIILMSGAPKFVVYGYGKVFKVQTQIEEQKKQHDESLLKYYNTVKKGSLNDVFKINSFESINSKMDFQFGIMERGYQTIALFLIGLLLGRKRYFEEIELNKAKTKKALKWFGIGAASVIVCGIMVVILLKISGNNPGQNSIPALIMSTLYNYFSLSLAGIIVCSFVLLYQKIKFKNVLEKLAPLGRMGLTTYVMQSLIATTIFYGFGFGLLGNLSTSTCELIGLGVFTLQVFISKWWMQHFHYGPLEWAWRSATYFKWQPFRKVLYKGEISVV